MKMTRRLLLAFLLLFPLTRSSPGDAAPNHTYTVLVGTYTDKTDSKGIYAFSFDTETGKLTPKGLAAETPNPSWVVIHPNGKWVYAANESGKQSTISAFSLEPQSAKLTLLNQLPAEGEDPCYLSFDKTGKYLLVANYTSGTVAVFPILDDGKLGRSSSVVKDAGPLGPNKDRQEAPHAHWIEADSGNHAVFVADLGLDSILIYGFDPLRGKLTAAPNDVSMSVKLAPGTGPRHALLFSGSLYVLGELQSTITQCLPSDIHWFAPARTVSTLPPDFKGRNDAAEIAFHPRGRWLYASNRGHDSLAIIDLADQAAPRLIASVPTGGKEPRHFAIDPTAQFLLAENQYSNSIVVFRINFANGALTQVSQTGNIPSPVCLAFQ